PIAFSTFQQLDLLVQSVNPATQTIAWSGSLAGTFNLTQPITIATGAANALGLLFDSEGNPTILLEAQSPGVWGDELTAFVAQTSLAAATTSSLPQPPAGQASYLTSIVGFSIGTLVKAYQPGLPAQYRLVAAIDPGSNALVWDSPLTAPLNFAAQISFE